jgi:hypothetical protein
VLVVVAGAGAGVAGCVVGSVNHWLVGRLLPRAAEYRHLVAVAVRVCSHAWAVGVVGGWERVAGGGGWSRTLLGSQGVSARQPGRPRAERVWVGGLGGGASWCCCVVVGVCGL